MTLAFYPAINKFLLQKPVCKKCFINKHENKNKQKTTKKATQKAKRFEEKAWVTKECLPRHPLVKSFASAAISPNQTLQFYYHVFC